MQRIFRRFILNSRNSFNRICLFMWISTRISQRSLCMHKFHCEKFQKYIVCVGIFSTYSLVISFLFPSDFFVFRTSKNENCFFGGLALFHFKSTVCTLHSAHEDLANRFHEFNGKVPWYSNIDILYLNGINCYNPMLISIYRHIREVRVQPEK